MPTEQPQPIRAPRSCPFTGQPLRHAESYALMLYANGRGDAVETIWNSRDGVAPFMLLEDLDEAEDPEAAERDSSKLERLQHISWGGDAFAPFHVPNIGDRIFVDLTEDRARASAYRFVERWWSDSSSGPPLSESYSDRAAAIDALAAEYLRPGAPDVVKVDHALQQSFLQKRLAFEASLRAKRTAAAELEAAKRTAAEGREIKRARAEGGRSDAGGKVE